MSEIRVEKDTLVESCVVCKASRHKGSPATFYYMHIPHNGGSYLCKDCLTALIGSAVAAVASDKAE